MSQVRQRMVRCLRQGVPNGILEAAQVDACHEEGREGTGDGENGQGIGGRVLRPSDEGNRSRPLSREAPRGSLRDPHGRRPTLAMGHPFEGGKKEKWLGNIVFGSWITLHMNGQLKKEPFVEALMAGRLPQWFEEQIRNDPKMSYYAKALVDGDLFGQIQWDREKLKLFDPKSRLVCLDAQFKYRSNTQTNAS